MIFNYRCIIVFVVLCSFCGSLKAAENSHNSQSESQKEFLKKLKTQADKEEIDITVKNIEITKFPEIKLIIEAYNKLGESLDTLLPEQVTIIEDGKEFEVEKIEKIPVANEHPWDFVFIVDITGSMQPQIDGVVENLLTFTNSLATRGIDYRLGLILFNDAIERVFQPTKETDIFLNWIKNVRAIGGGDEKENALEALVATCNRIKFRPEANRVAILITDAPYHQRGENGDGLTSETTESVIERLNKNDLRVFSISPAKLKNYQILSEATRGTNYDINYSFASVLNNFTRQITNLFLVTYRSGRPTMPDSIEVGLFDQAHSKFIKKTIPIVELGRKLIIENLLFQTGRHELPSNVSELNILAEFMVNKPAIKVTIEGHTDWVGTHEINDALSLRRANAVKQYLLNKGVEASRIQTTGFGKRKPIASNDSEFGRSLNRRTEIVITSK